MSGDSMKAWLGSNDLAMEFVVPEARGLGGDGAVKAEEGEREGGEVAAEAATPQGAIVEVGAGAMEKVGGIDERVMRVIAQRSGGNISDPVASIEMLPENQQAVIELLAMGKSVPKTALATRVGRSSIYRWLEQDKIFIEVLRRYRQELFNGRRNRVDALADKAIDAIERLIDRDNAMAVVQLLKGLGLLATARKRGTCGPDCQLVQDW